MIFDVARLVSYVPQTVEPLPGDLAPTGGPAGNGMRRGRLPRDGVYEFFLTAAPHPVTGAAGSPVNPLAMK
ncbi:hypothetical protein [Microbispora sp. H13382]|uniref:hypothetical protein n=1 Tax=Microbispora sp. H13382 TaxID=2729112 RepID=UPI001604466C|nr:hypothetical protein [Microbispora sp. H13382]